MLPHVIFVGRLGRPHPETASRRTPALAGLRAATTAVAAALLPLFVAPAAVRAADAAANKCDPVLARKLRPDAGAGAATGWTRVIVRLGGGAGNGAGARAEAELTAAGADITRRLPLIDAVAARVPNRRLRRLASLPGVARLSADTVVRKNDEFTVAESGAAVAWRDDAAGAIPGGLSGAGVTVAVVDSGIRPHRDLADPSTGRSRILASVDFSGEAGGRRDGGVDPCGHGTHVAGIIAGNGAASTGRRFFHTFYGIARRANLVSVRVLDARGQSDVSTVVAGIQWAVENRKAYNIRVLNLSLGHPVGESYKTDPLCLAVEQAWKAGIVVVCSAGNEGRRSAVKDAAGDDNEGYGAAYGSISSPANSPYVITVGAMKPAAGGEGRAYSRIATYSSRGPSRVDCVLKPDLVAPGNKVISTLSNNSTLDDAHGGTNRIPLASYLRTARDEAQPSNQYFRLSGTSMAAPVVAAAAALLLEKHPDLTPDTVKARLMAGADKWTLPDGTADVCTFGAGYPQHPGRPPEYHHRRRSRDEPDAVLRRPGQRVDRDGPRDLEREGPLGNGRARPQGDLGQQGHLGRERPGSQPGDLVRKRVGGSRDLVGKQRHGGPVVHRLRGDD
jgi:serine protease AprX